MDGKPTVGKRWVGGNGAGPDRQPGEMRIRRDLHDARAVSRRLSHRTRFVLHQPAGRTPVRVTLYKVSCQIDICTRY
ncbi:hypothetical protein Jann_3798 [Jannaschia sp. CCS1]|nr:hypothetical protein Jann_3798 [Jannaschia sp. CCS1]